MVKRCLDQATEAPSRRICLLMVSPECSFQSQTASTNFSRPRSWRDLPSVQQFSFHHHLCGYTGMVGARLPQGIGAFHPLPA